MTSVLSLAGFVIAGALAAIRWFRVAQREHYLKGSVTRFALRWWRLRINIMLALIGTCSMIAMTQYLLSGLLGALVIAIGPIGLALRGRSSPLSWTRRCKTVATTTLVLSVLIVIFVTTFATVAISLDALDALPWGGACIAFLMPLIVDGALALNAPIEHRLAQRFIRQASTKLDAVNPTVVAITGSYGKTTTKNYVAHLIADTKRVVASPASYNNAAGLSRTINEQLTPGTEVFVAEMGTYGSGEIRDLCTWVKPDIAVICAIGPVHLERMGTLDDVVKAKSEITENAPVVVLNTDAYGLKAIAQRCEAQGKSVVRYSINDGVIMIDDESIEIETKSPAHAHLSNVGCALAVAKALGLSPRDLVVRISDLPVVAHRSAVSISDSGVTVIDDTYNSNPSGAEAALSLLSQLGNTSGARVVVTPGMVELGKLAFEENARFARAAAKLVTHLIVVGQTNRRALLSGAMQASRPNSPTVVNVATRDEALSWVRANLQEGDAVLWENDLPDHFP